MRQQQMADALKALVLARPQSRAKTEAIQAISDFEKLDWQPQTFLEVLPDVLKVDSENETISYHGNVMDTLDVVTTLLQLYAEAIAE